MSSLKSDDRYLRHELPRLCQGDILRDIEVAEWAGLASAEAQEIALRRRQVQYVVVLSQECDLHQDEQNRSSVSQRATQDKYLHSVLIAPAFPAQAFKEGTHLKTMEVTCEAYGSNKRWTPITHNQVERYHYLQEWPSLQVPELVIDFKHLITTSRDDLLAVAKAGAYLASLGQLFRDRLSQRFANFLARIALPDANEESPGLERASA